MKKAIFILPIALIYSLSIFAQNIKYEPSLEKAKSLALEQEKPLAILITIQPPAPSPNFLAGLSDEKVIKKYNSSFVNYKIDRADPEAGEIIRTYNINKFPSLIFLDPKGGIMFSDVAILRWSSSLLALADRAIAATDEMPLADYDIAYNSGNTGHAFLKKYILKREAAGIKDNADLVEKYAGKLKRSDLDNYSEVLFILKAGPLAYGPAFKLAHTNQYIIDSIFKTESLPDRIGINNNIIANTMNSAIAEKNISRAYTAANFTRSTWTDNPSEGTKNWYLKMLQYYKAVNDASNYIELAFFFYDHYYMPITTDSLKRRDSLNFENARNTAMKAAGADNGNVSFIRTLTFSVAKDNSAAGELNNAAWYFYESAGKDKDYLSKALSWSKHSIELSPKPEFYDTYAHLLYKLKHYSEAEEMQQKAVDLETAENRDSISYKVELEKMKSRTL